MPVSRWCTFLLNNSNSSFQAAVLSINTWFLKKRGLAMGLMVSGSSLGGVCFPIMLRRLFVSVGFGWGVRAAAFLIFGCLVIANFLVRSRLPPPGWTKGRQIFDLSALKEPAFCLVVVWSPYFPASPESTWLIWLRRPHISYTGVYLPLSHFSPRTLKLTAWIQISRFTSSHSRTLLPS